MLSRKYFKTFSRSLFLPPGIAVLELPLFETFLCQLQFFILTERITNPRNQHIASCCRVHFLLIAVND